MKPADRQSEVSRFVRCALVLLLASGCATGRSSLPYALIRAEDRLEAGNDEEAVALYQAMLELHPNDPLAPIALNNLGVALERLGRFFEAESAYRRIVRSFPQSHFAPAAAFRVAFNADRTYRYEVAIWQYEQVVIRFPNAPDAPLAAFNRARLLEAMQDRAAAARAYRDYASRWPESDDAAACVRRAEWLEGTQSPVDDHPPADENQDLPAPPDSNGPGDFQQRVVPHG